MWCLSGRKIIKTIHELLDRRRDDSPIVDVDVNHSIDFDLATEMNLDVEYWLYYDGTT